MAEKAVSWVCRPPMPWFGIDIGGTLTKLVYFEPTDSTADDDSLYLSSIDDEEKDIIANIHHYLTTNRAYGEEGHRDEHLQMDDVTIDGLRGSIHFIRFPTSQMQPFVELCKEKGIGR